MKDFIDEAADAGLSVNPYFKQKLEFADTDLARYANVAMRMVQFTHAKSSIPDADVAHERCEWSVYEVAYALRMWFRQLKWHHGQYLFAAASKPPPADVVMAGVGSVDAVDKVARRILNGRFVGEVTTTIVRKTWLKNKAAAAAIRAAVARLEEHGLLIAKASGVSKGHPVRALSKRKWDEVRVNDEAVAYLQKLNVPSDVFEE